MKKFNYKTLLAIIFASLFIVSSFLLSNNESPAKDITYNEFTKMVEEKQVDTVYYVQELKYVEVVDKKENKYQFVNPNNDDFKLMLLEKDLKIEEPASYKTLTMIVSVFRSILSLYPLVLIYLFIKMMGSQLFTGGDAPIESNVIPDLEFKDIAGLKSVKKELSFLIEFLQDPKKFEEKDIYMPHGMLLYGPPGTGKTMLARAIAGEAKVPFFYKSGSDFVELYVGNGARKVRELFKEARAHAPCIIFIDEIDALAVRRGQQSNQEANQTVNAFLAEIDGFNSKDGVFVIGATNLIESLDQAFIRPGRFDKHICVPLPDNKEERLELFKLYSKKKQFDDDVDLDYWAKQTVWFSGADIKTLLNDAALKSLMAGEEAISNKCMEDAFYEKLTKGHKKERNKEEQQREAEIVAWHEAGHALIGKIFCNMSIPSVTIIGSTSGVGGFTLQLPEKTTLLTKEDLLNDVTLAYGGRIAEHLLTGDKNKVTTGASNDIKVSTERIKAMVMSYGMTDVFGMLDVENVEFVNNNKIMETMLEISNKCYENGYELLSRNKELLKKTAELLMEKETINETELDELIEKYYVE